MLVREDEMAAIVERRERTEGNTVSLGLLIG